MHELYLALESSLPKKEEEFLINEMMKILERVSPVDFEKAYILLIGHAPEEGSIREGILFIKKLKEQNFFEYAAVIRGINGSRSERTNKS